MRYLPCFEARGFDVQVRTEAELTALLSYTTAQLSKNSSITNVLYKLRANMNVGNERETYLTPPKQSDVDINTAARRDGTANLAASPAKLEHNAYRWA